jgi:Na+-driven multidrug efflux pump
VKFRLLKNVGVIAWPVATRMMLVHLSFTFFLKMMGMVGTAELAASNIVIAIASLAWMPGYGFGVASAALIGQSLGAGKPDDAEQYGWESVKIGLLVMGCLGVLFFLIPQPFMWIFTDDPGVIALGSTALRILAIIQFIDAVGIILSESLEGAGMVRFVMFAEIMVSWLYFLPSVYFLALRMKLGIVGGWLSLAGYIFIFAVIIGYRFKEGSWKTIQV